MNRKIIKDKNFLIFFTGSFVSAFGDAIYDISVIWYIINTISKEKSGIVLSVFAISNVIPRILLGPIIGIIVDKYNKKNLLILSNIIRGILMGILYFVIKFNYFPIYFIIIITLLCETFTFLYSTTFSASINNIINKDLLLEANALYKIINQTSTVFGAVLAGILYIFISFNGIILINMLSFLLSGMTLFFIQYKYTKNNSIKNKNINRKELKDNFLDGINYLKNNNVLLMIAIFSASMNFVFVPIFSIVIPKIIKFNLQLTSKEFCIYEAFLSGGIILSSIFVPSIVKKYRYEKIFFNSLFVRSALFLILGNFIFLNNINKISNIFAYITLIIITVLIAGLNSLINLPLDAILQRSIEEEYKGRFFGIYLTIKGISVPLGLFVFGVLSDWLNQYLLINIGAGILIITSLMMYRKNDIKYFINNSNNY